MSENVSKFETGETIIVKRGSKIIEAGSEVKVLARDTESGKYAVQTATGGVYSLAAERLARKPERTFTETEIRVALNSVRARDDFDTRSGVEVLDVLDATIFDD